MSDSAAIDVKRGVIKLSVPSDTSEVLEVDLETTRQRLISTVLELYGHVLDKGMAEQAVDYYLAHPQDTPEDIVNFPVPEDFFSYRPKEGTTTEQLDIEGVVEYEAADAPLEEDEEFEDIPTASQFLAECRPSTDSEPLSPEQPSPSPEPSELPQPQQILTASKPCEEWT